MFRQIVEIWRSQIVFLGGNTMKVAIFGAGTMGRGIAQVFAANGHTALLYASSIASAQRHKEQLDAISAEAGSQGQDVPGYQGCPDGQCFGGRGIRRCGRRSGDRVHRGGDGSQEGVVPPAGMSCASRRRFLLPTLPPCPLRRWAMG